MTLPMTLPTTLPTRTRRRSGRIAAGLALGLAVAALASADPATAVKPPGSRAEVMLETGDATGDPDNAITSGWWGHEGGSGPAGTGSTYLSLNAADATGNVTPASIAALKSALGTDNLANVYYAVVPFSSDGSHEAPMVTVGENAAEAFGWFMDASFGAPLSGSSNPNDSVITVSTLAQVTAWVAAGQPVQDYDATLVLHDVTSPGNPVSTAPRGTSILNTWPAGTQLSLVAYVADGRDPDLSNAVPLVKRGADGKAQSAWLPLTTVQSPTSPIRTSAGYAVAGAAKPTLGITDTFVGNAGTVTVTVKKPDSTTATNATGKVTYAPVVNNVPGSAQDATTLTNGVATFPVTLAPGGSQQYEVKYVAAAGELNYLNSDAIRYTVVNEAPANPTATATSLTATGTTTYTLKAGVAPSAAGSVTFSDGGASLGRATVSAGSASLTAPLSPGQHALKAVFGPSNVAAFGSSTGTANVWVPKVTTTVSPKKVEVGKKPKLTVALETPGTTATGSVTVTITSPQGKAKTITATLQGGKATMKLAKTVKGTYKLTITYAGSGSVLGVTSAASFKVKPAKK